MHLTRRDVLLAVGSAAAVAALSLRGGPPATAAVAAPAESRPMLSPADPDALIPTVSDHWYALGVSREPLNGWVHCTSGGEL